MKTELLTLTENQVVKVTQNTLYLLDLQPNNVYSVEFSFEKEGIEAEIVGLYQLRKDERLDLTTIAHHVATNTKCTTKIRAVLLDSSISNYIGKILIDKSAQQTTSFLDDKVLTLGKDCRSNSQPILEIDADDVKASHGATSGNIDEAQLYYLQSRGISRGDAQKLIIRGFFEEAISSAPAKLRANLLTKLRV